MEWLNYHHLFYFSRVAREGSLVRASAELRLAPSTVSGQIRALEHALGEKLFVRRGRGLALTDTGSLALRYAEDIFALGRELTSAVKRGTGGQRMRMLVGITDVLPKAVVRRLLEPALRLADPLRLVCREDRGFDDFVAELSLHKLDVVLADTPAGPSLGRRVYSRLLGQCGTTFFAQQKLATRLRKGFPRSLDGEPCLLPGAGSSLRRSLDHWLRAKRIEPIVAAEVDDSELMHTLASGGAGFAVGATLIEDEVKERHGLAVIGRVESIRQRFFAVSAERKAVHPGVVAILEGARRDLFA